MPNRYVWEIKCETRGRVLYLPYVPYLGMVYVICVTAESNNFCRCYSNGDVTSLYSNLLWQKGFIQYKALAVPLIRPRKVTQIILQQNQWMWSVSGGYTYCSPHNEVSLLLLCLCALGASYLLSVQFL